MNPRSRVRNARYRRSASLRRFIRAARDPGRPSACSSLAAISALLPVPPGKQGPGHRRLDEKYDLLEAALEQRPEDRRWISDRSRSDAASTVLMADRLERQRRAVAEQPVIEPCHLSKPTWPPEAITWKRSSSASSTSRCASGLLPRSKAGRRASLFDAEQRF